MDCISRRQQLHVQVWSRKTIWRAFKPPKNRTCSKLINLSALSNHTYYAPHYLVHRYRFYRRSDCARNHARCTSPWFHTDYPAWYRRLPCRRFNRPTILQAGAWLLISPSRSDLINHRSFDLAIHLGSISSDGLDPLRTSRDGGRRKAALTKQRLSGS